MNNLEKFKEKLKQGKVCFGVSVFSSDPLISELFSEVGYDFLWIDMEHTSNNKREILCHLLSTKGTDTAPFVRIPSNKSFFLKPILDMDPAGVIVPFIMNKEDALNAIKACRYTPEGIRGFGPIRSNNYGLMEIDEYFEKTKSSPWVILQIEHIEAVNKLDEILSVPGVNSIAIGPNDLSNSMGLKGQSKSKEVLKQVETITVKARSRDIPVGIAIEYSLKDFKNYKRLIDMGVNWIELTGDLRILKSQSILLLESAKKL